MNPNRGETGQVNFELPPQPVSPETDDNKEKSLEVPTAAPETVGKQAQPPTLPVVPDDIPAADQPIVPSAQAQDQTAQSVAQTNLPDSDHIPEIWVNKTKDVVAQTREDPYIRKNEVTKIKADYIQKRFKKELKMESDTK